MNKPDMSSEQLAHIAGLVDSWLAEHDLIYQQLDCLLLEWAGETLSAQANCGQTFYVREFSFHDGNWKVV